MGKALYRKYRPNSLDGIVGQNHVTDILSRSLKQGKIAHAYLLTGPRGVGKTSIARILAHEINKLPYTDETIHLDIIEIDAASNNGVEDVRDLREKVNLAPVSAAKKIYIIDEVHMLSKPAFNALLKTLEEPPEHVVFILATTDVHKLPATIISRTQRFGFRSIGRKDAVKLLREIADKEKIKIDDESLAIIAERGDGSFRDCISLLDQLSSLADEKSGITTDLIETSLGLAPKNSVNALLDAIKNHSPEKIIKLLDEFDESGIQSQILTSQLISAIRTNIGEKPALIPLLDALLDVSKSSNPNIKLLTVLINFTAPKTKVVALTAPSDTISKPIDELKKISNKPAPEPVLEPAPVPQPEPEQPEAEPIVRRSTGTGEPINWNKLVEYVKKHHVAIYSVLCKCKYEQSGDTLMIFTGTAFYKKKLDDTKYRPLLSHALQEIGAGDLIIETIATTAPPKDEKAASVAAIMGGGEEVTL